MKHFKPLNRSTESHEPAVSRPLLHEVEAAGLLAHHTRQGHTEDGSHATGVVQSWSVIVLGGLAGILFVLAALFLLHPLEAATQSRAVRVAAVPTPSTTDQQVGAAVPKDPALPPASIVGRYPPDFTLKSLDGQAVTLSELRGKPVWINFWATWCPPCRAEMPEMKQKYTQFKDTGLVILGVDFREDAEPVKKYITENSYNWTFLLDLDGSLGQAYAVSGIPTHLFVGRDGIIKAIQVGGIPANMMQRYLTQIIGD